MHNCDEDRSVFSGHYEVEVLIDRPVGEVWKSFLDIGSWVTSHGIEEVSGARGTVGSITRVSFKKAKELGLPLPHYHYCKIIQLVPERQYVLKTYSEKGGSYGRQMTTFDDTRFVAIDGATKLTFNIYIERKGMDLKKDMGAMNLDDSREGMLKNLNNLKRIVEGR
jgi:hypothetical protein